MFCLSLPSVCKLDGDWLALRCDLFSLAQKAGATDPLRGTANDWSKRENGRRKLCKSFFFLFSKVLHLISSLWFEIYIYLLRGGLHGRFTEKSWLVIGIYL